MRGLVVSNTVGLGLDFSYRKNSVQAKAPSTTRVMRRGRIRLDMRDP
jgi:hypothetical protein